MAETAQPEEDIYAGTSLTGEAAVEETAREADIYAGTTSVAPTPSGAGDVAEAGMRGGARGATTGMGFVTGAGLAAKVASPMLAGGIPGGIAYGATVIGGGVAGAMGAEQLFEAIDGGERPEPGTNAAAAYNAGETIGGTVAPSAAIIGVARSGARFAGSSRVSRFINDTLDTIKAHPGMTALAEGFSAIGAGAGAFGAEKLDPGDAKTRIAAEVTFGLVNPQVMYLQGARFLTSRVRKVLGTLSASARESMAAKTLQDFLEGQGEDAPTIINNLRAATESGGIPTAAQKTGNPSMAAIEKALRDADSRFGADVLKQREATENAIQFAIEKMREIGDPTALTEAAALQKSLYDMRIGRIVDDAMSRATAAMLDVTSETPDARAAISETAFGVLSEALKKSRSAETELWNLVPKDIPVGGSSTTSYIDTWKADMLPGQSFDPVLSATLKKMAGDASDTALEGLNDEQLAMAKALLGDAAADSTPITSGLLTKLRSYVLGEARKTGVSPEDQRRYYQLSDSIVEDLAEVADPAYDEARAFSKSLNDTFTRKFGGQALGMDGKTAISPELMLERAMASGGTATNMRLQELENATTFADGLDLNDPETISNYGDVMMQAIDQTIRLAAVATTRTAKDGTKFISVPNLQKFIDKNGVLLDRFELRETLENALKSEVARDRLMGAVLRDHKANIVNKQGFTKILGAMGMSENPAVAINRALSGAQPYKDLDNFIRTAGRGKDAAAARQGLVAAIYDGATVKATSQTGTFSFEKYRKALLEDILPGRGSVMDTLKAKGLVDDDQIRRLSQLLDEAARIEFTGKVGGAGVTADIGADSLLANLAQSVIGSRIGIAIAGASGTGIEQNSLIVARAGSEAAKRVFSKIPKAGVIEIIKDAAKNPEVMAMLLERPVTPGQAFKLLKRFHAYVVSSGIAAITSDGAEAARDIEPEGSAE